ncbi:heterokaryon incompatibility protein-domain-containing protein [Boeremia exigua]|uniref:heterokaryon incompatibility protein-domain-containing protein n=1 Tax=Boeremia exigua TaxID=749465 RepID=UPI001E8E2906|nr:heterokaryon incompatibility protein-domain-containing protein [Boeremia exigua]KAH6619010.1 heterokaryon incompatibility protein-domain-containing protein [Boeremia exigua]
MYTQRYASTYRTWFLPGIPQHASRPRLPVQLKPSHGSYQSRALISIRQGRQGNSRRRWTLESRMTLFMILPWSALLLLALGRELRDEGIVDDIAHWVFFHRIPPKLVVPPCARDAEFYQPLTRDKEIRLLVLEPGAAGDEVKCRLIHVEPSWQTRYEALSYCWGDESVTQNLRCSGTTIAVHASLHDALSDLRQPSRERLLWVDRLCINQNDFEEMEKQITLMGEIYSQARQVLIYLGKSDSSVEQALESISQLDRKFKCTQLFGTVWQMFVFTIMSPVNEAKDNVNWKQVINLFQRPWFQRTWIVQETVLARKAQVICGGQSITWAKLQRVVLGMSGYKAYTALIPEYYLIADAISNIELMAQTRRIHHPRLQSTAARLLRRLRRRTPHHDDKPTSPTLLDLVLDTRSFQCKNPRDKIFGMLGLTRQNTAHEYIQPKYTISTESVYRNFVLWEVFHNNSLRVLGLASDNTVRQSSCPSWVPRFDKLDPQNSLTAEWMSQRFNASAGLSLHAELSDQNTVLHLKGCIVDTLHTVGQKSFKTGLSLQQEKPKDRIMWYQFHELNKDMIKEAIDIWLAAARRSLPGHSSPPEAGELLAMLDSGTGNQEYVPWGHKPRPPPPKWEPFLRTFMFDQTIDGTPASDNHNLVSAAASILVALRGPLTPRWFRVEYVDDATVGQARLALFAPSRRFAATKTGLIGFVPTRARTGDLICIIHGAKVPFVVRKIANGRYTLVGECYMHGIMYGEGLRIGHVEDRNIDFALE